jgi:proteasome lid subunit RPN8/RPN11
MPPEPAATRAKVTVIDQANGKRNIAMLPLNVTVARLLPYLIRSLNLPTEGPGGAPVQYDLTLEASDGNRHLDETQTLIEAGVREGSVLRITPRMRAGAQATSMRYLGLRLTDLDGHELFETDLVVELFEPYVRQLATLLVRQGTFRAGERYNARIIPRADDKPDFEKASVLKASEISDNGMGFLDISFEQAPPPIDPVNYLTLQIRSAETNTAYRWDLKPGTQLVDILDRSAQILLDGNVLKDGDHFRLSVSAHDQGRPRLDPVVLDKAPLTARTFPSQEQDVGEITVVDSQVSKEDENIVIDIVATEELIKPESKPMASYTDEKLIGGVSEKDIPIFVKRSAMEQALKSAKASAKTLEEIGGFLLGKVFRDPQTDRLFVEVSEALEADAAKGTAVSLNFNYDAWRQVLDRISQESKDKIPVGWYHTHLISQAITLPVEGTANEYIARYVPFFSSPDLFIHRNFFPDPWHVALVMDLRCGHNVFFAWEEGQIRSTRGFHLYGE